MYDELIRQFRDKAERHRIEGKPGLARDYINAADAIEDLWGELKKYRRQHPVIFTADVMEVVRCKECWHHRDGSCMRWADGTLMFPDDYCSRGIRADMREAE